MQKNAEKRTVRVGGCERNGRWLMVTPAIICGPRDEEKRKRDSLDKTQEKEEGGDWPNFSLFHFSFFGKNKTLILFY